MDFIRKYDIELEKEHYYAGETLRGRVVIENIENLRVTGVQLFLRGKAHVEWRITRAGERRTVKEDQYFIDDKLIVWGSDRIDDGSISILPRGDHRFPFEFQLPVSSLPCSFESRIGTVRYYLRVIIDIPYASPPQGLKYFTVIGPNINCMDRRYTTPVSAMKQTTRKCRLCCVAGSVCVEALLEQTAYCCGERIRLKCDVQNGSDQDATLFCRLIQFVEFRINKGAFGLTKDLSHNVLELHSPPYIAAHSTRSLHDLSADLEVPVMPPTLVEVCKVIEINYILRIGLHLEKSGDDIHLDFPFVVATVPQPCLAGHAQELSYEPADDHVEGGIYVSPEFQLGQVYDGAAEHVEEVILYRPVYICIARPREVTTGQLSNGHSPSSQVAVTGPSHCAPVAASGGSCLVSAVSINRPKDICCSNTEPLASASLASTTAAHFNSSSNYVGADADSDADQRRISRQPTRSASKETMMKEKKLPNRTDLETAVKQTQSDALPTQPRAQVELHSKGRGPRSAEGRSIELRDRQRFTTTTTTTTTTTNCDDSSEVQQQQQQPLQQQHSSSTTDAHSVALALQSSSCDERLRTTQLKPASVMGAESGEQQAAIERGTNIKGRCEGGEQVYGRIEGTEREGRGRMGGGSEGGERIEEGMKMEWKDTGHNEERERVVDESENESSNKEKHHCKEMRCVSSFNSSSATSSTSSSYVGFKKSVVHSKASLSDKRHEEEQQQQQLKQQQRQLFVGANVSHFERESSKRREAAATSSAMESRMSKPGGEVKASMQTNAKYMADSLWLNNDVSADRQKDGTRVIDGAHLSAISGEKLHARDESLLSVEAMSLPTLRTLEGDRPTSAAETLRGEKDAKVLRVEKRQRGTGECESYQKSEQDLLVSLPCVQRIREEVRAAVTPDGPVGDTASVTVTLSCPISSSSSFTSSAVVNSSVLASASVKVVRS